MSKRFVIIGADSGSNLFLDLFPTTEYFYSLNRGGSLSTNVCELRNSLNAYQDFTPEQLEDATFTTFNSGNETRVSKLYNQGTIVRDMEQPTIGSMPNVGNPNLYMFNNKIYMSAVERDSVMATGITTPIFNNNATVYVVYRSQSTLSISGVFEELRTTLSSRVVIYSDTRNTLFRHSNFAPLASANLISFANQQPTETIRILALRKTGNLIEGFDESGLVASVTTSDSFSTNTFLTILRQTTGNLHFRGHLAELILRQQSDANIIDIINNRKTFYGI